MKKLILSIMLCFGVGLAMMGSPAQVPDDNTSQGESRSSCKGKVTVVAARPQVAVHHSTGGLKYVFTRKAVEPSQQPAGKFTVNGNAPKNASAMSLGEITPMPIVKDPTPHIKDRKGGAHTNGVVGPVGRDLSEFVKPSSSDN